MLFFSFLYTMKIYLFFFIFISYCVTAQNYTLVINSKDSIENKAINSIGYLKNHASVKNLNLEWESFKFSIEQKGYFEWELIHLKKENDSVFNFTIYLNKKSDFIPIYIGKEINKLQLDVLPEKDSVWIKPERVENWLQSISKSLEKKGFALNKVSLTDFFIENEKTTALLSVSTGAERRVSKINIIGYDLFPIGYKKHLDRLFLNALFTDDLIKKLNDEINSLNFILTNRNAEVLFNNSNTEIYIYASKSKQNYFDGLMGFANSEQKKISFIGYLDLNLLNSFNSGESNSIYWKNNGEKQTNLNLKTEWPFVFKTNFGIDGSLTLFKNDSLFQNSTTAAGIKYFLNTKSYIRSGIENQNSSPITNTPLYPQNKSIFYTVGGFYSSKKKIDFLKASKFSFEINYGNGKRETKTISLQQQKLNISSVLFYEINLTNIVYTKTQFQFLKSTEYLNSELYRFGGINTIRGFRENSLQGHFFTSLMTEYQFKASSNLILHSIFDIGYYEDKTNELKKNINGFGFGLKILRENSLFNLQIATSNNNSSLSNSLLHISFLSFF